ncbi:MAG: histidinol-phosphate transaminase [Gammaproteobacteria bacterium]|nr:histidinol-phosphate transaminase [Gammaproteobacteria bacterium]
MSEFDPAALCVPGVRELKAYEPGKPIGELERELGLSDIVKLASNENPLGASPRAIEAMQRAAAGISLYPDGNSHALKQALSSYHDIEAARIVTASGSDHILELAARAFLDTSNSAVMARYGFAIFSIVARATGTDLRIADAHPPEHSRQPYGHDANTLIDAADDSTRILYLANPNNPTGTWLTHAEVEQVLDGVSANTIVFLDEAYHDYVAPFEPDFPDSRALLERYPNLIVTRTFSKAYGLAGARVGYGLTGAALADVLNRVRLSFNPGSLAQAGAAAALGDREHVERAVALNHQERGVLDEGLRRLGLVTIPSVCNFVTVDVGRPGRDVFQALLQKGLITRPLDPYGLPNHLRISVGLEAQNARLLRALGQVLA